MRVLLSIFLFLTFSIAHARLLPGSAPWQLSFFYGPSYRSDKTLLSTYELEYYYNRRSCTQRSWYGLAARLDYLNKENYALGLRYFACRQRRRRLWPLSPVVAVVPSIFQTPQNYGFNIKPELYLRITTGTYAPMGVTLCLSYGYEIPIIGEEFYFAGRHELSAKLAITFNAHPD